MRKLEEIKTAEDVENYVEGCVNDFEFGLCTKDELIVNICELVANIFLKATKTFKMKEQIKKTPVQILIDYMDLYRVGEEHVSSDAIRKAVELTQLECNVIKQAFIDGGGSHIAADEYFNNKFPEKYD
jgi:hypothetical protein